MRGSRSSCTAWRAIEKAPEITACEAMTAAMVASTTIHGSICGGIRWKNGCWIGLPTSSSSAPWPK